jgi:hypothetical protein
MGLLKDRTFIILSIILLIIVSLSVIVSYKSPMNVPSNNLTPLPINGVCSVDGYVVDSNGNGIPNATVTLHIIKSNQDPWSAGWDYELFNMTTTTNRVPSLVGYFTFNNVLVTPSSDYAYLSAIKPSDVYCYILVGQSNSFALTYQARINQTIVLNDT